MMMFRYRGGPFKPHLYLHRGTWRVSYNRDRVTHFARSPDFQQACRYAS